MKNITDIFVEGLWDISNRNLDRETVRVVKNCILDYLGVTISGAVNAGNKSENFIKLCSNDKGNAPIIGTRYRASLQLAALINGINAHTLELDDGHRVAMVHSGAVIMSALFTAAENFKISADGFMRGIVTGYEAALRLAIAIQPGHKYKGYHVTGTCGVIGAAVALITAQNMDQQTIKRAVSAAATSAAGILEIIEDESELKPYNAGRAAMDGVAAAMMAMAGFDGPNDVLGGERGFLNVMSDKYDKSVLVDFDEEVKIKSIYQKPYAACRYCHAPIDAVFRIKDSNSLAIDDIEEIIVDTFSLAVKGHDHVKANNINSAKMSIPYSVAVSLVTGQANIDQFTKDTIYDEKIKALATKVKVNADEEISGWVPNRRAARVTVKLINGDVLSYMTEHPKGEPENPITDIELKEKFLSLTKHAGMSGIEAEKLISLVECFDEGYEVLLRKIIREEI